MSFKLDEFMDLKVSERINIVKEMANLTEEEAKTINEPNALKIDVANSMIENVIGTFELPYAVAFNFLVNGKEYVVPMVTEEAYLVSSVTKMAKTIQECGGFTAGYTESLMIGQVQLVGIENPTLAKYKILENKDRIIEIANNKDPKLVSVGGGVKDVEVRILDSNIGPLVTVHLLVNTVDAMGANAVNTMAEAVAPFIEELTEGKAKLKILSNLADRRIAYSTVKINKELLGGEEVVDGIVAAYEIAEADPYRAATHNKGILNGIIPVALATCNDSRAIEAGCHAYTARSGQYRPLTKYKKDKNGDLLGLIETPMAVGTVGGNISTHPMAKVSLNILGVETASELGQVIASVGLAQNLTTVKSIVTGGLQADFAPLHARSVAIQTGATNEDLNYIIDLMVKNNNFQLDYAKQLYAELK
ncbi:hydroxymethylglutaryl-CoA reductase, degradative [Psychrobacillus sp. NPDC093180]|uniref:hydroxymethylglutaryl-CoA reductase, degradative n=1 Tax=Psychrobacillus sp. NPDC093180 TaxID=3364489 RepID=UPI0038053BD5